MKFTKTRSSGKDQDVPVFEFAFGLEELKLLIGVCKPARRNMPDMFECRPMKARLSNIIKELGTVLYKYKKNKL